MAYKSEADTLPDGVTEDEVRAAAIAVHEAGHAVVAWHLGMVVESVSVIPNWDSGGRVLWGSRRYTHEPERLVTDHEKVLIAMGGMMAALNAGFGVKRSAAGCSSDLDKVRALGWNPHDEALWSETLGILRANWTVVEDLTFALNEKEELSYHMGLAPFSNRVTRRAAILAEAVAA